MPEVARLEQIARGKLIGQVIYAVVYMIVILASAHFSNSHCDFVVFNLGRATADR